ncbi:hypothetical protein WMY93_016175 [Mugilogobius chulae]|uniref:LRRCT domain-containing protein n=1 Tax=Mugilogobius chulae TaxID=88201 RepID=A0AAW0NWI8_9GOBI
MKMWRLYLQLATVGIVLQTQSCSSCTIFGSTAVCLLKDLNSVPSLPSNTTHLFLGLNQIREITSTSLSHLPMLQQLDLGHQHVPLVIRNNAFSKQTNMTRLDLSMNRNLQIEPGAFAGLSKLKVLKLELCDLNEQILSSRILEPLKSLEELDLSANDIKRLQPAMHFVNMTDLKDLNLKLNRIGQICEADMAGLSGKNFRFVNFASDDVFPPSLKMLNLADNFIAEPKSEIFKYVQLLDLRMNRFHCGPGLEDFVSWIKETNVTLKGSKDQLKCEFPSSLYGASLVDVYA